MTGNKHDINWRPACKGGFSSPHVTNPQNLGFNDLGLRDLFHPRE